MRPARTGVWPAIALLVLSVQGYAITKTTADSAPKRAPAASDDNDLEEAPPKPPDAGPVLTQPQIIATLKSHRDEIQRCYETEATKNRTLAGHVVVQFTITATGAISDLGVKETTLKSLPVEQCILHIASGIVFSPKPASPITLAYGWNFAMTSSKKNP